MYTGGRSGRRFILTLAAGMVFGFLSACLLITSTRDVPHMFSWVPGNSGLSRDPHHYSELESEVCNVIYFISNYDIFKKFLMAKSISEENKKSFFLFN